MESPEQEVSLSEFARIARYKPSYVTALKAAGRLVLTDDGKRVLVQASLKRIETTRDPSKAAVAARHAEARDEVPAPQVVADAEATPTDEPEGDDEAVGGYAGWRARRERALALREERNNAIEEGRCMVGAEVVSTTAAIMVQLRRDLENLGDVIGAQLTDPNAGRLIDEAVEEALANAARGFARLGRNNDA